MLENVTFDTKRNGYVPSTAQTTGKDTYLSGVLANLRPMGQHDYNALPQPALEANYIAHINPNLNPGQTDIGQHDLLVNITRLDTGQPYDDAIPLSGQPNSATVIWSVIYAPETRAGPLGYRVIYVRREAGTGPGHR